MADLFGDFGPEEAVDDEGVEAGVASREIGDADEARLDADDEVAEGEPVVVQVPKGIPSPAQPTAEEVALHWLNHLPYRSWCKWCVSGKRGNTPHRFCHLSSREIPLLVANYCYLRDRRDEDLITCFVGKLYPSRCMIAIPCDVKGVDDYANSRLTRFLRNCGITRLAYMCDQEKPLNAMIRASMHELGGSADWKGAILENSAVGESQSNGKAESAVKTFEDHLRVMKAALESRLSARLPSNHPVTKWLIEYTATVLNKYAIQSTGRTAYHDLHGRKVSERIAEFGEVILHYIPRKKRHKLDMRWGTGVFLGTTMNSNETYVGLKNGAVIRCRAIARVRPDQR